MLGYTRKDGDSHHNQQALNFLDSVIEFTRASRPEAAHNSAKSSPHGNLLSIGNKLHSVRASRTHVDDLRRGNFSTLSESTYSHKSAPDSMDMRHRFDGPAECDEQADDSLPRVPSSKWLHKAADVEKLCNDIRWRKPRRVGPGFNNLGNTCFFNSVLQCLTYTAPLAEFALSYIKGVGRHGKNGHGKSRGQNMVAIFCEHIHNAIVSTKRPISPAALVRRLQRHWRAYRFGRQEDAHECLRSLVEALQQNFLVQSGLSKNATGPKSETTLPHRIFGGILRSQLRCTRCNFCSNSFEPFLDLSVEIGKNSFAGGVGFGYGGWGGGGGFGKKKKKRKNRYNSVHTALGKFTHKETLDQDNKWFCDGCKSKVRAEKQLTIRSAPLCLVIHLKRFTIYGRKQSQHVEFQERLNLEAYMSGYSGNQESAKPSKRQGKTGKRRRNSNDSFSSPSSCIAPEYELYGVIVHAGHTIASGHYYAFVRNSNDVWYEMDDSQTRSVSINTVLKQQAYMLFYRRIEPTVDKLFGSVPSLHLAAEEKARSANSLDALTPSLLAHPDFCSEEVDNINQEVKRSAISKLTVSTNSFPTLPPVGAGSAKLFSLQGGATSSWTALANRIAGTKLGLADSQGVYSTGANSRLKKRAKISHAVDIPIRAWMTSGAILPKFPRIGNSRSNVSLLLNHFGISPGLRTAIRTYQVGVQNRPARKPTQEISTKVTFRHGGKMANLEGNEEIEVLSGSGLLSNRTSNLVQNIKDRRKVWMGQQKSFRQLRASESRNDLGVSSWNFQEHDDAIGDDKRSNLFELAGKMKRHQKEARKIAMKDDREWQRSRRHDEWDREYDRGKLKKVKSKVNSASRDGSQGRGGVNKTGSNSEKFQQASVMKHGDGEGKKGAVRSKTWVAPVQKNRKKRRREISKGTRTKFKSKFGNASTKRGKPQQSQKFTLKTW